MSLLRIASPHSPTLFIDQGPSVARSHSHTYGIHGSLVTARKAVSVYVPPAKGTGKSFSIHLKNRRDVCGVPMMHKLPNWKEPTGQTCGRLAGHADTHRSRETMTTEAARRRTGHRV